MVIFRKAHSLESMTTANISNGKTNGVWGDSLRYAPSALVPAAMATLAAAVFTRLFDPAQYGLYGLVLAVSAPVATVIGQSVGNGTGRYYIEYHRAGKLAVYRDAVTWLVSAGWIVCLSLTGLAALCMAVFSHASSLMWMIVAAGLLVGLQSTVTMLIPILSSSFRPTYYSIVNSVAAVVSFGGAWLLVWSLGHHAYWLIFGSILGQAFAVFMLLRRFPLSPLKTVGHLSHDAWHAVVRFLTYGTPMVLWVLSSSVMGFADRTTLQIFDGSAAVGIYGINSNMASQAVGLAVGPFITASWPILMKHWADSGPEAVQKAMTSFTRSYLMVCIGIIGMTIVVGNPLESLLLGHAFVKGAGLLVPCVIGRALWGGGRLGHSILKLAHRTRTLALDALVAGAFNVLLTFVLVPRLGMFGAAYSLIPSFALYTVLVWIQSKPIVPWTVDWRHFVGSVCAVSVAVVVAATVDSHVGPLAIARLGTGAATFGAVYGLAQALMGLPNLSWKKKGEPHIG